MHNGRRRKVNILDGTNKSHKGNSKKNTPWGLLIPNIIRMRIQEKIVEYENNIVLSLRFLF